MDLGVAYFQTKPMVKLHGMFMVYGHPSHAMES